MNHPALDRFALVNRTSKLTVLDVTSRETRSLVSGLWLLFQDGCFAAHVPFAVRGTFSHDDVEHRRQEQTKERSGSAPDQEVIKPCPAHMQSRDSLLRREPAEAPQSWRSSRP